MYDFKIFLNPIVVHLELVLLNRFGQSLWINIIWSNFSL
jgi:hypothetical protein